MKRTDIKSILVIGSGPIVIGQAAEFDYSGTQSCKALREEGYRVILVNSNPATIMTDADRADAVYIEPLTVDAVRKIIEKEKPDGILGTMGGQTGLNLLKELYYANVLKDNHVEVLGTSIETIEDGEDRDRFKQLMVKIGEPIPKSAAINTLAGAKEFAKKCDFPLIIRPAYTLGGTGGGFAYNMQELEEVTRNGLDKSLINQVLIEEALLGPEGWGEFEFEVMRDVNDNCIIICPMENFDPMGIHTGESIVTAPTQTLNDNDFQKLRTSAIKIIRALKVVGGCNVQFSLNYKTGDYIIIEVNPRVSRSSALASKATGYPIAKVAAKLSIGMTLDEIKNDVTKETYACFEPTIDYVVLKIPRWPFDKFKTADKFIGTQMKSTGETMAIGRTFEEALQKAIRSLEIKKDGLTIKKTTDKEKIKDRLVRATDDRLFYLITAFNEGFTLEEIYELTGINQWFLKKIQNIFDAKIELNPDSIKDAKKLGFSDSQIAERLGKTHLEIRDYRKENNILPVYKMVDTCAAEFEAKTPYLYSTYEDENECNPVDKKKVIILGSGPIRIGQGIEFDYSCVHGVQALRDENIHAIIINNNPETVSTDFDTSDKLFFEPLTFEDVMNVIDIEKPDGVILQFGGQTSINLAMPLKKAGVKILGTSPESIDLAEDREKFGQVLAKLGIPSPDFGTAYSHEEALIIANRIGYPVLVRPSYVLGGRAMEIVDSDEKLQTYMIEAVDINPEHPVLVDKFLGSAIEIDVDALGDGDDVYVAAIMEHVEHAGIHSGDSSCVIPPQTLSEDVKKTIIDYTTRIAKEIGIIGLINIQYAVKSDKVYILEANPRASRTVPYVSKAINKPIAKIATQLMLGKKLKDFDLGEYTEPNFVSVKVPVFPFLKLIGVDPVLSPEMKSTGEVMGIDKDFGRAFYKAQLAACQKIPHGGNLFLSVGRGEDKETFMPIAREYSEQGFKIFSTEGTARMLTENGIECTRVPKISENPKTLEMLQNKELDIVILVPQGSRLGSDGYKMRRASIGMGIPYITTIQGAMATIMGIKAMTNSDITVKPLKEHYENMIMKKIVM